jgi:hypothetical protein
MHRRDFTVAAAALPDADAAAVEEVTMVAAAVDVVATRVPEGTGGGNSRATTVVRWDILPGTVTYLAAAPKQAVAAQERMIHHSPG